MTPRLLTLLISAAVALSSLPAALAQPGRTVPSFESWTVDCGNTGVCFASSFTRSQSVWVDLRIVRDWHADAQPLVRLTTNTELPKDGTLTFEVDGTEIEALPIEQLREMQPAVKPPAGFRPLGGEGFWYPTGPATLTLLEAMRSGKELTIRLPAVNDAGSRGRAGAAARHEVQPAVARQPAGPDRNGRPPSSRPARNRPRTRRMPLR